MFDLPKNKKIYVSFSGGADSSLLLYELSKHHNDRKIVPLIFDTGQEPAYRKQEKCKKILDVITKENNYNFEEVHLIKAEGDSPRPVDFYKFLENREEGHVMLGITKNPNVRLGDHEQIDEQRSKEGNYVCVNGDVLDLSETPYSKLTKRDIALKYYEYGIHNKLFPLTFSCIVNTDVHCGKCWWCQERLWGFGRII